MLIGRAPRGPRWGQPSYVDSLRFGEDQCDVEIPTTIFHLGHEEELSKNICGSYAASMGSTATDWQLPLEATKA